MNSKLLYAATIALSLISTWAVAGEASLTRAQVEQDTQRAIDAGTLRRGDYEPSDWRAAPGGSVLSREQVASDLAQARHARRALVGPQANRTYNPDGTGVLATSTLARSTVKQETLAARAAGGLQRTDVDDEASLERKARQHAAGQDLAERGRKSLFHKG